MNKNVVICPYCGEEIYGDYNYETGHTDYDCSSCDSHFTEDDFIECDKCGNLVYKDDINEITTNDTVEYLCNDCMNNSI
ncbi:MAG: hypothetical protein IAC58_06270 [Firmicutes bacterium]|uniref:Uncharacterized protein n=1 Tax=Candidatus Onthovivens merdipullorum TaxID=2840889 RepID=A0A9D9DJV8_9BACL|nr:hypothetical protein [Candidatus Onthovivens merdipullorum]